MITDPNTVINTKHIPPGLISYMGAARMSTSYFDLTPYPYYGFMNWKTEDLGPFPKCLPIPKAIIRQSARWLFGKPIEFHFPGSKPIEKDLKKHWDLNHMTAKLVPMAIKGGKEGGVSLKFSYDQASDKPVRFQILSDAHQVRYFYDPLDGENCLMARIQFPYMSYADGEWYWYREEWTKDLEIHYVPQPIKGFANDKQNPYLYVGDPVFPDIDTTIQWVKESEKTNKFGIIPLQRIKNIDTGELFGVGDLFDLNPVLDRINLAYHLMDNSNQLAIDPVTAFIDLEPKDNDGSADKPLSSKGVMDLKTVEDESAAPKQGKIQVIETQGNMREHLTKYANDLKEMLFDTTGSVFPRQDDVTNKGSLTQSVLIQMYAPLLEITREKHKSYGDEGIGMFLKKVVFGLKNLGIAPYNKLKSIDNLANEKLAVNFTWFSQFESSEDEKFAAFDRIDREVQGGYIESKKAVAKIAQIEELRLSDEEIDTQAALVDERTNIQLTAVTAKSSNDKGRGNDPGGNEDGQIKDGKERKSKQQGRGATVKDAK